jgi:hypothetical protein
MSISERQKEIRRRRKRRAKYTHYKSKLDKMGADDKEKLIEKLRRMTSGADELATKWGLR